MTTDETTNLFLVINGGTSGSYVFKQTKKK
jgi:hypothetical protein